MLRYILKREIKHENGLKTENFFTLTKEEDVEACLKSGGFSETTYDVTHFIGVEVVE